MTDETELLFDSSNDQLLTRRTRYSHKMGPEGDGSCGDLNGGSNSEELERDRVV